MSTIFNPSLSEFSSSEMRILEAKLDALRVTISHSGEKGRYVENEVQKILRDLLPSEYGISTGFIAYHNDYCLKEGCFSSDICISGQIDIIIYDALRCGPIIRLDTCNVFPLEAVFGYIEVKTLLTNIPDKKNGKSMIDKLLEQNINLRTLENRFYWTIVPDGQGNYSTSAGLMRHPAPVPIRSYIFILEADKKFGDIKDICNLFNSKAVSLNNENLNIKGIYINNKGLLRQESSKFKVIESNALLQFKTNLFHDLSRYPRAQIDWTPAIDLYFK